MAKKALVNKQQDAEVQGPRLHALPPLWPVPCRVPQVQALPHLPARAGTRRRDPRRDEGELVREATTNDDD